MNSCNISESYCHVLDKTLTCAKRSHSHDIPNLRVVATPQDTKKRSVEAQETKLLGQFMFLRL
jgi:hypothetical protein